MLQIQPRSHVGGPQILVLLKPSALGSATVGNLGLSTRKKGRFLTENKWSEKMDLDLQFLTLQLANFKAFLRFAHLFFLFFRFFVGFFWVWDGVKSPFPLRGGVPCIFLKHISWFKRNKKTSQKRVNQQKSMLKCYLPSHNHESGKWPPWRLKSSARPPCSTSMIMGDRVFFCVVDSHGKPASFSKKPTSDIPFFSMSPFSTKPNTFVLFPFQTPGFPHVRFLDATVDMSSSLLLINMNLLKYDSIICNWWDVAQLPNQWKFQSFSINSYFHIFPGHSVCKNRPKRSIHSSISENRPLKRRSSIFLSTGSRSEVKIQLFSMYLIIGNHLNIGCFFQFPIGNHLNIGWTFPILTSQKNRLTPLNLQEWYSNAWKAAGGSLDTPSSLWAFGGNQVEQVHDFWKPGVLRHVHCRWGINI